MSLLGQAKGIIHHLTEAKIRNPEKAVGKLGDPKDPKADPIMT